MSFSLLHFSFTCLTSIETDWSMNLPARIDSQRLEYLESNDDGCKITFSKSIVMLDEHSLNSIDKNGLFDQLPSLDDLRDFDMGKYTMRLVTGTDRLYKIKTDRSSKLLEIMAEYRRENRFCDVVLCVNEERIPAHRVVLASASSYFASMFGQPAHIEARTTEDIDLTKLLPCPTVVRKIVDFIYTSQVELNDRIVCKIQKNIFLSSVYFFRYYHF